MSEAAVETARAELRAALDHLHSALERARIELAPSREELARLQAEAESGRIGAALRELAGHVAAGRTTWPEVFDGSSPQTSLLCSRLEEVARRPAPPTGVASGHAEQAI